MKKIAIMGGTFNPIHNGHIIGIQKVYDSKEFQEVWLMPSKIPPFKQEQVDSSKDRLAMCQLACSDLDYLTVSKYEMSREEVSYTYDTLLNLSNNYTDTKFYWVIGYDNLIQLETWYNGARILEDFGLVLLNRGGYDKEPITAKIKEYQTKYNADIIEIQMPNVEISSTEIRERVIEGKSITGYTMDRIIEYIDQNSLYER